jgi:hypothetical protein
MKEILIMFLFLKHTYVNISELGSQFVNLVDSKKSEIQSLQASKKQVADDIETL